MVVIGYIVIKTSPKPLVAGSPTSSTNGVPGRPISESRPTSLGKISPGPKHENFDERSKNFTKSEGEEGPAAVSPGLSEERARPLSASSQSKIVSCEGEINDEGKKRPTNHFFSLFSGTFLVVCRK